MTWNRAYAHDFYGERVYRLEGDPGYDPSDRAAAWEKAQEWGMCIPIGVFYRGAPLPPYEEQVRALQAGPLVLQQLTTLEPFQIEALRAEIT